MKKPVKIKKTPLAILKKLIIPLSCVFALFIGIMVGYVILGKQPLSDVFSPSTWTHVFKLLFT